MNTWTHFDKKQGIVYHCDGRPQLWVGIDKFGNAHLYMVRTSTPEQHAEDQALVLKSRCEKIFSNPINSATPILILRGQSASKPNLPKELHSLLQIIDTNIILHVTAGDRATRHPEHIRKFQNLNVVKIIIYKAVDNIEEYDLTNKADSARLMCIAGNALVEVLTKGQLSKEGKIRASRKRLRNGGSVSVQRGPIPFGRRAFYLNKSLNDAKHHGLTEEYIELFLELGYTGVRITPIKINQFISRIHSLHNSKEIIRELKRYRNCEECHMHKDDLVWFLNKILGSIRVNMSKNMIDKIAHWIIYTFSNPTKVTSIRKVKEALLFYKDKKYYSPLIEDAPVQLVSQIDNTLDDIIGSMQSTSGLGGGDTSMLDRLQMLEEEVKSLRGQLKKKRKKK